MRMHKNYYSSQELQSIVDLGFHTFFHRFQWSLAIACLFFIPIIYKSLFCYLSIFCMIIIFFLFLPFWHKIYFWKQNNGHDSSVKILKILILSVRVKSIPCNKENNICALQQNVHVIRRYPVHISH